MSNLCLILVWCGRRGEAPQCSTDKPAQTIESLHMIIDTLENAFFYRSLGPRIASILMSSIWFQAPSLSAMRRSWARCPFVSTIMMKTMPSIAARRPLSELVPGCSVSFIPTTCICPASVSRPCRYARWWLRS